MKPIYSKLPLLGNLPTHPYKPDMTMPNYG